MSVERKQIQHYHTTNSEAIPDASDLLNGEIALNINKGNEKIFIKNSDGGISSFRGEQYYEENFLHKNDTAQSAIDLTGRIEATPEEFKYRPSAGEKSIKDDSATIKRIKGSSLVWNNLAASIPEMADYRSNIFDFDGVNTFTVKADTNSNNLALDVTLNILHPVLNHYYLFIVEGNTINDIVVHAGSNYPKLTDGWAIVQCTTANYFYVFPFGTNKDIVAGTTFTIDSVKLVDLTKMFGAGYEPTTLDEFYARIPEGVDINAYNEGELINFTAESIKTTGLNQWDEQWEVGYLASNGTVGGYVQNYIRAKNYIPVISGEWYYASIPNEAQDCQMYAVDENYNLIKQLYPWVNSVFQIPEGAAYIRFYLNYGSEIYNNDICINLSHSGVRDGEYESYKEFTHDLSWIKKYFPNGMRSAGSAYDEIVFDESKQKWVAIQRIGEVDLGSLTAWENHSTGVEGTYNFVSYIPDAVFVEASKIANIVCSNLHVASGDDVYLRKYTNAIALTGGSNKTPYIAISHPTYTTSAQKSEFMTSIQGVILYYELAEPIVTEIDDIVNFSYEVGDFGTEEIISNGPTTPFKGDIVYQFNAVDRIRDNSRDIEKLKNSLNNGVKPYVIDTLEFANELGNFTSDETGGFSGNGHITQEQYNEIIKSVENKNLIFSVGNTYWNYAALKSPYQDEILISTRIEPAIPGLGGLFYDIMMFIDEETLECSVVLDGRGDISILLQMNLKTVNGESLAGSGNINIAGGSSSVSILYGELVNLRDNNGLIPGTWYRITDYITTTSQENTSSAGHPFDVIVLATSENTLSEEARAIKHDGDEYFNTSNLDAWKIWYCLDNDTNRFEWADTTNGKGVIYRMIDEYGNDCPYDFKNIMFKNPNNNTDTNYYYTFYYRQTGKIYDATTHSKTKDRCYNNVIKSCKIDKKLYISNNIFLILSSNTGCYNNTFGNNCYNNTFGDNCYNNTFGDNCNNNIFGIGCYNNIFGDNCYNNVFGNSCNDNTFGNSCNDNSFTYININDSTQTKTLNGIVNCYFSNEYQYNELKHLRTLNTDTSCYLRNVHFCKGVKGTSDERNTITIEGTLPDNIETKVAKNSKGELKIYCEADLIP